MTHILGPPTQEGYMKVIIDNESENLIKKNIITEKTIGLLRHGIEVVSASNWTDYEIVELCNFQ